MLFRSAYLQPVNGFEIVQEEEYKSIIRNEAGVSLREVEIQLRIHKVVSTSEETQTAHVCFLCVVSPLAFSLRQAVFETLFTKGRKHEGLHADERRRVWNLLATHVRTGLRHEVNTDGKVLYETEDPLIASCTYAIEWIRSTGVNSFSSLFNIHSCLEWITEMF